MTNTFISMAGFQVVSHHGMLSVMRNSANQQLSLHATSQFAPGEMIVDFWAGSTLFRATRLTIQTGLHQHITLLPDFLQYVNHSCEPNVFFDTSAMKLVCIRAVTPGEELRFFYPSTEWSMAQPFVCNCGANNCRQLINGAAHLSADTLAQYRITDFINQQLQQKI